MRAYVRVPLKDRFEEKVMPIPWSGCWIWTGSCRGGDRGYITDDAPKQKTRLASRVAYELYKGPIPQYMCVCHTCDVPACVNPAHLWLGTTQENTADRNAKGRQARNGGEHSALAKLTWEKVAAIRADQRTGKELSEGYGVSQGAISSILNNKKWITRGYKRVQLPGNAKLTISQVREIKKDSRSGRVIAHAYGVSQGAISDIKRGKNWVKVA